MALFGCDSFVVLPPLTAQNSIIFGKNSDRPNDEVQEVIYQPLKTYRDGEKVQCTYIEINQSKSTYPVLLSKPSWMWGAEMGANSQGVVIGNEAVWTSVFNEDMSCERLLGMDLVRLGLERASNSSEAVNIITQLLEMHGQGGPCSDIDSELSYHNSFLIADPQEAWVLETAGKLWAAEKVTSGFRNISNCLSIGTNIMLKSDYLESYVTEHKLWASGTDFNFKDMFSLGGCPREASGRKLLQEFTADKTFDVQKMFQILRNKPSTICRSWDDPFYTSGSWVSELHATSTGIPSCHWVTATPDPSTSVFKPFIFSCNPDISKYTVSPVFDNDPAKLIPRFQFKVDRRHELYRLNEAQPKNNSVRRMLEDLEKCLVQETSTLMQSCRQGANRPTDFDRSCDSLLRNAIEKEIKVYHTH